jgi:transposase
MDDVTKARILHMLSLLDEKQRRLYLAVEAKSMGRGGLKAVHELTGISMSTIIQGQKELNAGSNFMANRIRKSGSGRKPVTQKYENIKDELEKIMEKPVLDCVGPILSWSTKSLRDIADLLCEKGFKISHDMVGTLLVEMGYSLRQKCKMLHFSGALPDKDAQFRYINQKCREFIKNGQPIISIVSEERELIVDFRHILMMHHDSETLSEQKKLRYDFPVDKMMKTAPYELYKVDGFLSFVNLGSLPGMVDFGVEGILRWWKVLGCHVYGDATQLCVVSDGGGRGGVWYKLWKKQLQVLADVSGLEVHVLYLPPGTHKWHMIRHELFCFTNESAVDASSVAMRVAIKTLSLDYETGIAGVCVKDDNVFGLDLTVTDEELSLLNLVEDEFYGTWNYVIQPI